MVATDANIANQEIRKTSFPHGMMESSFWKDTLYEVIGQMDPWDIDISELATEYASKVEQMEDMNFTIPANVVIVTAVLLRMKADIVGNIPISMDEFRPDFLEGDFDLFGELDPSAFSSVGDTLKSEVMGEDGLPIKVNPKRIVKRRVTAAELINAIQGVLEEKTLKQKLKKEGNGNGNGKKVMEITIEANITELIEETYKRVMELIASKDVALFSEMANSLDEKISTLMSLLYLSNNQKVKLEQEHLYEEIFIKCA
ncbi:MAG: segregation/condensation protein A [Candidatus Altiarchaeales archaeon]|nr:segregation/condensation protein A [Candidatus Altiarchaeota archaeon]MBU4341300.1 segregation/condensation protein A [Candidatus Altiarchaeota archaeon]MBU4406739.1 segregation/condensation protein A [Candidatus Altiarchaeota archaeon]MBU4437697.1 segregation/condensation protein A [Candidatus Altiarchaeota archaeon]MCG2783295.1 segregation/condensation protein A [Candidatus Altiarchaeales archaeon]